MSSSPANLRVYAIGPRPIKERRWQGVTGAAFALLVGVGIASVVGSAVYDTHGIPQAEHHGHVVSLWDEKPVIGNMTGGYTAMVKFDDSNTVIKEHISHDTYNKLQVGAPVSLVVQWHRLDKKFTTVAVNFKDDMAAVEDPVAVAVAAPRRPRP